MSTKVSRAVVGYCGLAVLLSGCASPHPSAGTFTHPPAAVHSPSGASVCDLTAEAGSVPEHFTPVAVYVCELPEIRVGTGQEQERPGPASPIRGDLTALLDALAVPNDPPSLAPCTEEAILVPELWLANSDGDVARVAYPTDECGKPKWLAVDTALDGLRRS